jgi:ComF family protein
MKKTFVVSQTIGALFFPSQCYFCVSTEVDPDTYLCSVCNEALRFIDVPFCKKCGRPMESGSYNGELYCLSCMKCPPKFDVARYGVIYSGGVRDSLKSFKYNGALHQIGVLSWIAERSFKRHFDAQDFDLLAPVPIHTRRLIHRGFNQSALLAEKLSQFTGLKMDRTSLRRIRDTPPQVGLPRKERVLNVRNAFKVCNRTKISSRRILLVDDVSTTGSTISEASKALLEAGAETVSVFALALKITGSN